MGRILWSCIELCSAAGHHWRCETVHPSSDIAALNVRVRDLLSKNTEPPLTSCEKLQAVLASSGRENAVVACWLGGQTVLIAQRSLCTWFCSDIFPLLTKQLLCRKLRFSKMEPRQRKESHDFNGNPTVLFFLTFLKCKCVAPSVLHKNEEDWCIKQEMISLP